MLHPHYPSPADIDLWCSDLLARADAISVKAEWVEAAEARPAVRNSVGSRWVKFERPDADAFYGVWQPARRGPSPLVVHVPGYGTETSVHPVLQAAGYNVLHVNPQGYHTPSGPDEKKKRGESQWPVLPDTLDTGGRAGYREWLTDALVAVSWAMRQPEVQPDRVAFFGTSQGGGTALLLASLLRDRGVRAVCADEPYLTGFYMIDRSNPDGTFWLAFDSLAKVERRSGGTDTPEAAAAWRAMGTIDTHSHAHRMTMPTLLTGGTADTICPPGTIRALFDRLPGTRSYTEIAGMTHGYTPEFGELTRAWCALYL